MMGFSSDGSLMLYSVRQGGADEVAVHVRDMETGEDLPDHLPNALYSGVEFDEDGSGFYYTHRSRLTGPRIRHHTLGEDPAADEEIWGEGYEPTAFIGMDIIDGGRYRIFTVQHGWASNDLFIQEGDGPVRPVVEGVPAHFQHRYREGRIYIRTDWQAPNYRLMVADPSKPGIIRALNRYGNVEVVNRRQRKRGTTTWLFFVNAEGKAFHVDPERRLGNEVE